MNLNFKQIPQELVAAPQWILWRSEERGGKKTKVPYQVNGTLAQSNNKHTWSSFSAVRYAFDSGEYDGIGFMFSKEDPFIGIDIDKCVVDGELSMMAEEVAELISSYTEMSPSEQGIHIIVKGELPEYIAGTGKKNPELGLEVYRHGRYFTFTGNHLPGTERSVEERTEELQILFDKFFAEKKKRAGKVVKVERTSEITNLSNSELWLKMFKSKNGSNINDLYNGQLINGDHSSSDLALCNHLAFWTDKDSSKMDSLFRETALYREKWDKRHSSDGRTYGEMTIDNAIQSTSSTISDFQPEKPFEIYISKETEEIEDEEEVEDPKTPFFHLTELGNAERIIFYHGENLRFCNELEWLIWNGKVWEEDSKREIEQIAAKTFRALYQESRTVDDESRQKQLYEWAKKCERRSVRINSILDARPMVSVKKTEFDAHKYLFNCDNGVIDLKTGKLLPHDRELLLTKISRISYNPEAECPNWTTFLNSIFKDSDGNTNFELINFLQKAVGYTLTGDITEQVMFFLYGTGRNGKSTFINTIQTLLGDYGRQTNSDTFIKKKNDTGINNDIARLDGARFVSAVESEDGQQLSESLVKQITGGEKMSARFLRQEFFEFTPEFKVFFTTNHKPIIRGSDEGIWRRIRLIPFTYTVPKEQIDKHLPEKIAAELPGILRWAVEGCLMWQKDGLGEPASVREATEGYRNEMDIIGPFFQEMCLINPLAKVEAKKLYDEYKRWCFDNGEIELKNRAFYRQLESRGFKKGNGAKNKIYFFGIGLQSNPGFSDADGVNERVNELSKDEEFINPHNVTSINRKKL
ncbi:phage/plasmid primase, P4 family [Heyndrickxia sp. MSNUG]|uniref:phage/plasmid primase, P4 family n=1 Tax=Heyndrickxia sp. MSNUG TaxID=3136677 RepID=UPI003C2D3687